MKKFLALLVMLAIFGVGCNNSATSPSAAGSGAGDKKVHKKEETPPVVKKDDMPPVIKKDDTPPVVKKDDVPPVVKKDEKKDDKKDK